LLRASELCRHKSTCVVASKDGLGKTTANRRMSPGRSGLIGGYWFGVCDVHRPILIGSIRIDVGCFKSSVLSFDLTVKKPCTASFHGRFNLARPEWIGRPGLLAGLMVIRSNLCRPNQIQRPDTDDTSLRVRFAHEPLYFYRINSSSITVVH
jgi:hypothetical protein